MTGNHDLISTVFYLAVFGSLSFVFCKHALHMFQQNRYELYRYTKWLFSKNNLRLSCGFIYAVTVLAIGTLAGRYGELLCLLVTACFAIYLLYAESKRTYIKDLVLTNRVKRQIVFMTVLVILSILAFMNIFKADIIGILMMIVPYLLIYIMALLTAPLEHLVKKRFENEARDIISGMDQIVKIGITGSYGKTSTKNIISDIISDDFYTLITPASYNTPMGITRTIREQLKPIHEVFVCEMGADKKGDISYLMDFVKPRYGVVTSIGPQHLATFHSIENIINEKMQEIEMLPQDGTGFINLDNEYIRNYRIRNTCKVVSVGIDSKDADFVASDVKYTKKGSTFTVGYGGKNYRFSTVLLGRHNITNILLGIAIAVELGIDMKKIVKNVSGVRQVEHRLEVRQINGLTFIDDAFNSNPAGSKMALDVLEMMDGNRVIVTPGMIDLGEKQSEINREFGRYMKDRADYVLLVGRKQTAPIMEGLKDAGFDEEKVLVFDDVKQAFGYVYAHFTPKDTILLENDLPDAFSV